MKQPFRSTALFVALLLASVAAIPRRETTALGPPVCDPGGPYAEWCGCPIEFDASGSEAPGGTIVSYVWDFGDGTTGQGVRPTHTYYVSSSYTVTLTVTDDHGASSACSTFAACDTDNIFPPLECDAGGPYAGEVGNPIQFTGTADTFESPSYRWDFGDGATGKGASAMHTYTLNGRYTARLEVTDFLPVACHMFARDGFCEANVSVGVESIEPVTWGAIKVRYR